MELFHPRRALCAVIVFSAAAAAMPLFAADSPRPREEEVVELSPFTVSGANDTSWVATTTLVGNRTNQELATVPVTVDVLTSDFMRDIGAFSMEDAAQFVSGVVVSPRLESRNDDGRISYRGLGSAGNTSRNFFVWYVPSDTYNVERYDFNKGSNSLMFGDANPGGQATIYTKRAKARNFEEVFGSAASYGSYRLQLDVNRKLTRNLYVRVNLVNRTNKSYVHENKDNLKAGHIAFTYEPFKTTTIRVEAERGESKRVRADSALAINDGAAAGAGFSTNNVWIVTSDHDIFLRTSSFPASIDRTGPTGNQVSLLQGQTRAVRLPDGTYKIFHGFDKHTNLLGTGDYANRPFNVFNVTLEQRIGKLMLEAAYNQQFQHEDRNDASFGTTQSPPVISVTSTGRPYLEMGAGGGGTFKVFGNIVKAGRLSAVYPFDFGRWGKQFVVLTAQRQRDAKTSRRYGWANDLGTGLIANNALRFRAYLGDPGISTPAFWDQFKFEHLPTTSTFKPVVYEAFTTTGPFADVRYTSTYTASVSGEYFGGRLHTLLGTSWNSLRRKIPTLAAYQTDARGFFTPTGMPWENGNLYEYDPSFDLSATSKMAGATIEVWRRPAASLNVYGVYSESFNWQSRQVFYGPDIGPVRGKTKEFGFKGDVFNRTLFYTLAFYQIKRVNAAYTWLPDVLPVSQLEDLINPNNVPPGDPRYVTVVNGLNNERRTVNSSDESRGFDLTLQGQRWHGLQLRLTASATHVRSQADFSRFREYLQAAVDRTNAANAPGGDKTMAEQANVLANAQAVLGANTLTDKVSGLRSSPYSATLVLDYEVPRVRGLRVGVNTVYVPDYNVAIFNGVAYSGGSMMPLNGYVMYDTKLMKRNITFRVGIQNAYDLVNGNSPYRITGATSLNSITQSPNFIYRYAEPTVVNASVTVRF